MHLYCDCQQFHCTFRKFICKCRKLACKCFGNFNRSDSVITKLMCQCPLMFKEKLANQTVSNDKLPVTSTLATIFSNVICSKSPRQFFLCFTISISQVYRQSLLFHVQSQSKLWGHQAFYLRSESILKAANNTKLMRVFSEIVSSVFDSVAHVCHL